MNVLITGGMGVNGAVTARLLVKEGLHPVLLDNRKDLSLMRDIRDNVDCVEADVCISRPWKNWWTITRLHTLLTWRR